MITDVDAVLALQGLCDEAASIAQSLATIAAIQSRRERAMVTRKLRRLEHEAQRAEYDADQADRKALGWPARDHQHAHYQREKTAARARADRMRRVVNEFRLEYAAVLTLQDVSRSEVSA